MREFHFKGLWSFALLCCVCAVVLQGESYSFSEFPLGVFSADSSRDKDGYVSEREFERLKRAGVNLVHSYGSSDDNQQKLLDRAQRHGMKVMVNLNRSLVGTADGVEVMRKTVRKFKNHPALGFWYLYDEPSLKNGISPEKLRPFYAMLKQETPQVPVAITLCWDETFDRYQDVLDIQMADIYPVRLDAYPTARLDSYSTFVEHTKDLGKPVIGVPQLMSWQSFAHQLGIKGEQKKALRFPNLAELRYFYFSSLAQGVSGMVGFSYYHAVRVPGGAEWWEEVAAKVLNEVKEFTGEVMDPCRPLRFKRASDGQRMVSYWRAREGKEYIVMVNCWPMPVQDPGCYLEDKLPGHYNLKPWKFTRQAKAWIKNHALKVQGTIDPWEVLVWQLEQVEEADVK